MNEVSGVGSVPRLTDLKSLRARILTKSTGAKPASSAETLAQLLAADEFLEDVRRSSPQGLAFDAAQFVQSVQRAVAEDDRLSACEPRSVLAAALRCAEVGVMVGGAMEHAFIVPRAHRNGRGGFAFEAELILGYRGMIALAMRSGKVKSITSRIVTDREVEEGRFDLYYEGEKDVMLHRPIVCGDKGEPAMVYCLVRFTDGTFHVEPMAKDEIEQIRDSAIRNWNGVDGESPWVTRELEMWRKCPIRRAYRYLDIQVQGLDSVLKLDDMRERGLRQNLAKSVFGEELMGEGAAAAEGEAGPGASVAVKAAASPEVAAGGSESQEGKQQRVMPAATVTSGVHGEEAGSGSEGRQEGHEGGAERTGVSAAADVLAGSGDAKPVRRRRARRVEGGSEKGVAGAAQDGPVGMPADSERGGEAIESKLNAEDGASTGVRSEPVAAEGNTVEEPGGDGEGAGLVTAPALGDVSKESARLADHPEVAQENAAGTWAAAGTDVEQGAREPASGEASSTKAQSDGDGSRQEEGSGGETIEADGSGILETTGERNGTGGADERAEALST